MKSSTTAQRVGIFVDVQNMFHSAYDCFRGRLNYKKLLDMVASGREVVRAVAYAMHDGNNQSSFFTMLREVGFELRTKERRVRPDGTRKGAWDIGIAIETLAVAPRLDVVCLVTGDGDFVELVDALRAQGVRVEVMAFERNVGRELREAADEFTAIGEEMIFRDGTEEADEATAPEMPREPSAPRKPREGAAPRKPREEAAPRKPSQRPAPEVVKEKAPAEKAPAVSKDSDDRASRSTPPKPPQPRKSSFGAGLLSDAPDVDDGDDDDEIEEVE